MALTIGGVTVPVSCYLQFSAEVSREGVGPRTLRISGTGLTVPDLSSVDFSDAVAVSWPDAQTHSARTMTILAPSGLSHSSSLAFGKERISWSLEGVEASGGSTAVVTIEGVDYLASISVDPLGGRIQRMSDGDGLRLQAWSRRRVRIEGTGTAPSVPPGEITIASAVFSDDILIDGVSASVGADGAKTWTIEGEEV